MEAQFGQDFSQVRVHDDQRSAAAADSIGAAAYTTGSDIVFSAGRYRPDAAAGREMLAHELAHVVQQAMAPTAIQAQRSDPPVTTSCDPSERAADAAAEAVLSGRSPAPLSPVPAGTIQRSPRYTPEQREAMRTGRITGSAGDLTIANRYGFQPGDIVFRLGSRQLAQRIGEPVTHGGVYLGGGLIHDMVGFGNRDVPVTAFFAEADDPSVLKVIRFTGPRADIIVPRVIANLRRRNVDLPRDAVPWNLFSSADDYQTATCLEYAHAQFLYAIREISMERVWAPEVLDELQRTYFRTGQSAPQPLIRPRELTVEGAMGIAVNERRALIAAADYLAEDVDPSVFANRWEGREELRQIAPITPAIPSMGGFGGPLPLASFWQREILNAFTYRSFVEATRFFTVVR